MKKESIKYLCYIIIIALFTVFSCYENHPPQINSYYVYPFALYGGDTAALGIEVIDPDDDPLRYEWECQKGTFIREMGEPRNLTSWIAPGTSGAYNITAYVYDDRNLSDTIILPFITVLRETVLVIDTSFVPPRKYPAIYEYLPNQNWIISFSYLSMKNDSVFPITFIVLDEENFNRWQQGQPFDYYYYRFHWHDSYEFKPNTPGKVYFLAQREGWPEVEAHFTIISFSP